jgi:hypothetical protein
MVESSDLQSAIQRTQAMERIQALQAQQDGMNKKRFELERERESAEKRKKVQDSSKAESKRVVRDHYESGGRGSSGDDPEPDPGQGDDPPRGDDPPPEEATGGKIDVVV